MGKLFDKKRLNEEMNSVSVPSTAEAIDRLKLGDYTAYITADSFIADPYALLGQVIQIRKTKGVCPDTLNDPNNTIEWTPRAIQNKEIDENKKLKEPLLMNSIVIDKKLSMNVSFLSYLSAQLDANSYFSLMVFNQVVGFLHNKGPEWSASLKQWEEENMGIMNDSDICYLFVVLGFVQKNIVRKKYIKLEGKAKGGAYGVNINGEFSTSTEEYSLDIRFGLTPGVLKRPGMKLGFAKKPLTSLELTSKEYKLFESLTGVSNIKVKL